MPRPAPSDAQLELWRLVAWARQGRRPTAALRAEIQTVGLRVSAALAGRGGAPVTRIAQADAVRLLRDVADALVAAGLPPAEVAVALREASPQMDLLGGQRR